MPHVRTHEKAMQTAPEKKSVRGVGFSGRCSHVCFSHGRPLKSLVCIYRGFFKSFGCLSSGIPPLMPPSWPHFGFLYV